MPTIKCPLLALLLAVATLSLGSEARAACEDGYYPCGDDYCAEEGTICCEDAGRPDMSCPEGYACTSEGCVSEDGLGGCEESCGDGCMPAGADCCGGIAYCDPGMHCAPDQTGCLEGGPDGYAGGSDPGSHESCKLAPLEADGCEKVEACCDLDSCVYRTEDGTTFECAGPDCSGAADDVVAYCDDLGWGCSSARGASGGQAGAGTLLLLASAGLLRARRRPCR